MTVIRTLVLLVPMMTAAIVAAVARREDGTPVAWRKGIPLLLATAAALVLSFAIPLNLIGALIGFAVLFPLTFPVMTAMEAPVDLECVRTASLEPRRVRDYLPIPLRAAMAMAALGALAWVIDAAQTSEPRRMLFTFTAVALTFFLLYETWLRQEIFEVRARDERDRRRRVRTIFAAQTVLTISFLILAALSIHRELRVPIAVAATLIGVPGCALALSTGVQQRYLERVKAAR